MHETDLHPPSLMSVSSPPGIVFQTSSICFFFSRSELSFRVTYGGAGGYAWIDGFVLRGVFSIRLQKNSKFMKL